MLRQSLVVILFNLTVCVIQAKTALSDKQMNSDNNKTASVIRQPNNKAYLKVSIAKLKISQNFHSCFKEAWNLQWQNYCVIEATKSYKALIPKSQQAAFKKQVKSCNPQASDVTKLDSNDSWKIYDCEMHVTETFAR